MEAEYVSQNMNSETTGDALPAGAHREAAGAFVERARSHHAEVLVELYIFGSTVRGEASGRSSDVDVLIVLEDTPDQDALADSLRDIAYDVMLEYGPLVELHILAEPTFKRHRREGNPFVRNVLREGRSYA
ncbi:nucleotidyltransferase domain-containing protein [Halorussus salinus]|uniref:nucleotidyltransferase domain-containing protein n=1 Tax=Halorussus salinus TaxID=1364935 RepID=UPI001EE4A2F8|nr:nucleotidyltransferase domain-containing protein [Halorussus salinus]